MRGGAVEFCETVEVLVLNSEIWNWMDYCLAYKRRTWKIAKYLIIKECRFYKINRTLGESNRESAFIFPQCLWI